MRKRFDRIKKRQQQISKTVEESSFQEPIEWVGADETRIRMLDLRDRMHRTNFPFPVQSFEEMLERYDACARKQQRRQSVFSLTPAPSPVKSVSKRLKSRQSEIQASASSPPSPIKGPSRSVTFMTEKPDIPEIPPLPEEKDEDQIRLERMTTVYHFRPQNDQRPIQTVRKDKREIPKFVAFRIGTPQLRTITPATVNLIRDKNNHDQSFPVRLISWRKVRESERFDFLESKIGNFFGDDEDEISRRRERTKFLKQTTMPSMELKKREMGALSAKLLLQSDDEYRPNDGPATLRSAASDAISNGVNSNGVDVDVNDEEQEDL